MIQVLSAVPGQIGSLLQVVTWYAKITRAFKKMMRSDMSG